MTPKPGIITVLRHYGAERVPEGRGWRAMRCPFHENKQASASVNGEAFNCHGCGVHGDAIALIREQEGLNFIDAVEFAMNIDSKYQPVTNHRTRSGRKAGKWAPPGRRGRQHG